MPDASRTRFAILGALSVMGPSSGYAIQRGLSETVAHFWHESFGQLYPVLAALEREGLVADATGEQGPRRRRTWALTAEGQEALATWIAEPVEPGGRPRNELLLKLFFAAALPRESAMAHLRAHRARSLAQLAVYDGIEAEVSSEPGPDQPYWLATVRYGVLMARATVAWCDETLERLEQVTA